MPGLPVSDVERISQYLQVHGPTLLRRMAIPAHEHDDLIQNVLTALLVRARDSQLKITNLEGYAHSSLTHAAHNWRRAQARKRTRETNLSLEYGQWRRLLDTWNDVGTHTLHWRIGTLFEMILHQTAGEEANSLRLYLQLGRYDAAARQLLLAEGNNVPTEQDLQQRMKRLRSYMSKHRKRIGALLGSGSLLPAMINVIALEHGRLTLVEAINELEQEIDAFTGQDMTDWRDAATKDLNDLLTEPAPTTMTHAQLRSLRLDPAGLRTFALDIVNGNTICYNSLAISDNSDVPRHVVFAKGMGRLEHVGQIIGHHFPQLQPDFAYVRGMQDIKLGYNAEGTALLRHLNDNLLEEFFDTGSMSLPLL